MEGGMGDDAGVDGGDAVAESPMAESPRSSPAETRLTGRRDSRRPSLSARRPSRMHRNASVVSFSPLGRNRGEQQPRVDRASAEKLAKLEATVRSLTVQRREAMKEAEERSAQVRRLLAENAEITASTVAQRTSAVDDAVRRYTDEISRVRGEHHEEKQQLHQQKEALMKRIADLEALLRTYRQPDGAVVVAAAPDLDLDTAVAAALQSAAEKEGVAVGGQEMLDAVIEWHRRQTPRRPAAVQTVPPPMMKSTEVQVQVGTRECGTHAVPTQHSVSVQAQPANSIAAVFSRDAAPIPYPGPVSPSA
eukprot:Hpha_TRINITY_DN19577_c0_g1::TRINITY_DN19577_c0_g1_i1::g.33627::m.33627